MRIGIVVRARNRLATRARALAAERRVACGSEIEPAGARWHVVSDERDGADFDYTVEAWRAAFTGRMAIRVAWRLAAQIGSEFDRHHDFEDDTGARIDVDAESTAFAAVAVRYEFEAD